VFVIGGGPAGLAVAIAARRKGFDVTLADGSAPPIDKACGEGLLPQSLTALHSLGISISSEDGHPIRGIRFYSRDTQAEGRFLGSNGIGLRRVALHARMVARAQSCGVRLLWDTSVAGISAKGVQAGKNFVSAKWIVGADGATSRTRRWARLDRRQVSTQRFGRRRHFEITPWSDCMEVYLAKDFQLYVTPIGRREVCVAMLSRSPQGNLAGAIAQFPALAARLAIRRPSTPQRGAVTFTTRLARVHRDRVALVGDASGSVDAITGDGLRLAFLQALALADAFETDDLAAYERKHREIARGPRLTARLLLSLDGHPFLQRRTIGILSQNPALFSRLMAAHEAKPAVSSLLGAGLHLGWRLLTA
jgi:flavin-dependent dehydrogenase